MTQHGKFLKRMIDRPPARGRAVLVSPVVDFDKEQSALKLGRARDVDDAGQTFELALQQRPLLIAGNERVVNGPRLGSGGARGGDRSGCGAAETYHADDAVDPGEAVAHGHAQCLQPGS